MRVELARPGALVVDSEQFSEAGTAEQARRLRESGVDCVVGYLGGIDRTRLGYVLDAGMAFAAVTYGTAPADYDGALVVEHMRDLELPEGVTAFLDVEGPATLDVSDDDLVTAITHWTVAVKAAGYDPGAYFGNPQPLTSELMWRLPVRRYWKGQGRTVDRDERLAEPLGCGWNMVQAWPSHVRGGVLVDAQIVSQDYLRRTFNWVVGD